MAATSTVAITAHQLEKLAEKVAEKLLAAQDEMWPLERLSQEKGFSKSWIYHNCDILGGVKAGGKWFFSRNNIEAMIRSGRLVSNTDTKQDKP